MKLPNLSIVAEGNTSSLSINQDTEYIQVSEKLICATNIHVAAYLDRDKTFGEYSPFLPKEFYIHKKDWRLLTKDFLSLFYLDSQSLLEIYRKDNRREVVELLTFDNGGPKIGRPLKRDLNFPDVDGLYKLITSRKATQRASQHYRELAMNPYLMAKAMRVLDTIPNEGWGWHLSHRSYMYILSHGNGGKVELPFIAIAKKQFPNDSR